MTWQECQKDRRTEEELAVSEVASGGRGREVIPLPPPLFSSKFPRCTSLNKSLQARED